MAERDISLPLSHQVADTLVCGDALSLTGPVYTMRDVGHERTLAILQDTGELPFSLTGQTLFYAGPTPPAAGRPFGAVGPTTASRMDFATPALFKAGIVAAIGKGMRGEQIRQACMDEHCVYLAAVGGAAALLAEHVESAEEIAWPELGTEALVCLQVERFPVFVAIDTSGRDLYRFVAGGGSR